MCVNLYYYPLVKLDSGKQKILFNYGVRVDSREKLTDMLNLKKQVKLSKFGLSYYQSLNSVFKKEGVEDLVKMVSVPCGRCHECMNMVSREWAFKICKEAELYPGKCYFVTLTYNDDNVPQYLIKDEISKFNKKLKVYLSRNGKRSDFRFYGVGEYGSKTARPHYHIIYFNLDIDDVEFFRKSDSGFMVFRSNFLESVWNKGFVEVGSVTVQSASYVARYCDKKRRLSKEEKLKYIDEGIVPEFSVMSRRPGIGSYYKNICKDKFLNGIFNHFVNGSSYSIPVAWLKEIKAGLTDEQALKDYEVIANLKASTKFDSLFNIADSVDLKSFYKELNFIKTKRSL